MASPEGYFHRPAVKALVERLAALRDVVFYVGAGASIERTGLTWDGLTAELLSAIDASGDYSSRIERVLEVLENCSGYVSQSVAPFLVVS